MLLQTLFKYPYEFLNILKYSEIVKNILKSLRIFKNFLFCLPYLSKQLIADIGI